MMALWEILRTLHSMYPGAHAYAISGKLMVYNGVLNAGDYVYEPAGRYMTLLRRWATPSTIFIWSRAVVAAICFLTRCIVPPRWTAIARQQVPSRASPMSQHPFVPASDTASRRV